ncbi:putative RNA polymerase sigma factor, region 3/4, RNA polymerase sigma factor, region 2 [Helianthus annuus]|uniref:Putative RNApolymerase sigma-subunit F n=1 Tax=Helianthus annuus TaxID=4232 RepID=A0A251SQY3_HELAN|nr:RNA polymerase sigma factor sigF, chloroplastic [Helianthus annuus]KAF5773102.1 putative RNA polymerase sigma factor, region 3/4, RNA polymerase sigma factor, region 2 [Helianthus annuus]KAJ0476640.1 putative RNA polymerase sigma-70 region 3, RNA polymerase sigma-70 region 2 [Helianthus annuus]KAJ0480917.1 putative RNA polymerase sigma-70 region 3, RNA polymerase sigma-70 region 2 [Helianthus annuus]KAJ0497459.1 putative RNA polymerase sigma-70 region 3, RNA polymerase sigma-70 region 2 [Hel
MEAAASKLLSSSLSLPPRTQLKQSPHPPSALKLYEPTAPAHSSMLATSLAQHFPTSVLIQEQRPESRPLLQTIKDDKTSQAIIDSRQLGACEVDAISSDRYLKEFQSQLLQWPGLWLPSSEKRENTLSSSVTQPVPNGTETNINIEMEKVIALAKQALSASKEAASLVDNDESFKVDVDNSKVNSTLSLGSTSSAELQTKKVKFVKSTRLLERQSKRRKGSKSNVIVRESTSSTKTDLPEKKTSYKDANLHDPLRTFLARPVTRELLNSKEELELIAHIKCGMKLEEVRCRLHTQYGREPTLVEWAEAASLNCQDLKSQVHLGNSSREKLICANLRMVVYIAKQYRGRGLDLQDLLQEGSMGLMRSVQKFKPQAGCRFATYAYWWIRQSIRRAIFQNSKLIRLPEGVYTMMYKVSEAKRLIIREGNHEPTQKQIADQAGMTVEKLQKLKSIQKITLSLQKPIWANDSTTYEEITPDTTMDSPDDCASKQLMRNHINNLLGVLNQKERKVIRLRYGIGCEVRKSLADIGIMMGVTKERIRQVESRALFKLKQYSESQGLDAYKDLLI